MEKGACINISGSVLQVTCPFVQGVTDIRFSKCSGWVIGAGRNRHICGIRAADMPFSNVLLENCWKQNGTLRKSNVLHQSTKGQVTCKTLPLILIQAPFSENIVRRKEESICQTLMM